MKYLLLLIVCWVGYTLWRQGRREAIHASHARQQAAPKGRLPQPMVQCAHCGLHLPQADALSAADHRYYCCDGHRKAGPK
ncbi:MAG: hypothetical protein LBV61_09050 [Burkholderiaceae bacterium]|jgi:uncharacterized protein|nr:hypothetical protein [Burkholderiaceae bacterium]